MALVPPTARAALAAERDELRRDLRRLERAPWDSRVALYCTVATLVPLGIGAGVDQLALGAVAAIGALNLLLAVGEPPGRTRFDRLVAACVLNAVAYAVGTWGSNAGWLAVPFAAVGIFAILSIGLASDTAAITTPMAAMFVFGVGLPGGSVAVALQRFELSFLGGALALVGWIAFAEVSRRRAGTWSVTAESSGTFAAPSFARRGREEVVAHAVVVAATAALGLALADALGLVRDYWIMLTVLVSLRATLGSTFSFASMRVTGTVAGAVVALGIVAVTPDPWLLGVAFAGFGFLMFAIRWVNYVLYTLFLTPYVILLLNLVYPGDWNLALWRVVDTLIGGGLSLAAAVLLALIAWQRRRGSPRRPADRARTASG
jgi:Fusaric acid resistance protein-like